MPPEQVVSGAAESLDQSVCILVHDSTLRIPAEQLPAKSRRRRTSQCESWFIQPW